MSPPPSHAARCPAPHLSPTRTKHAAQDDATGHLRWHVPKRVMEKRDGCKFRHFTRHEAQTCLASRRIAMMGDAAALTLYRALHCLLDDRGCSESTEAKDLFGKHCTSKQAKDLRLVSCKLGRRWC